MAEINVSNSAGRDAVVTLQSATSRRSVRWVDQEGRQASSVRLIRSTVDCDIDALSEQADGDLQRVSELLLEGDPEVDMETIGGFLRDSSRVYLRPDRDVVHRVLQWEVIRNPDGSERQRRPREVPQPNVSGDVPLKWSGVLVSKADAVRKFVFASTMQLQHINGLTYDFLYGMAKELEASDSLMLLGAGPKSSQPLILRRGAMPYRGFLEGRTDGDRYCLLLHLSNMELRTPTPAEEGDQ